MDYPNLLDPNDFFSDILDLERELDSGWPWPLDAVQRFFEDLWSYISNIVGNVVNAIRDRLSDFLRYLYENIAYPLARFAWEVYLLTYEWTREWPEPWASVARFMLFPSAFLYKSFRDYIAPALSSAVAEVRRYFDGAVGGVFDAIRNAFSPIFEPLRVFAETVYNFFTQTMPSFIKSAVDFFASLPQRFAEFFSWIKDAFSGFTSSLVEFFTKTIPESFGKIVEFLGKVGDTLRTIFTEVLPQKLVESFTAFADFISKNVVEPVKSALAKLWDTIVDAIRGFVSSVFDFLMTIPEDFRRGGIRAVLEKLLPIVGAGFGIALAVDLASVKVVGSGVELNAIKAYLDRTVFKVLDPELFTSVMLAIAVQKPLEYAVKTMFRTSIPSPGEALQFLSKNLVTEEEAANYLRMSGYPEELVKTYLRSIYREPSFREIFVAKMRGAISEDEYRAWLSILNIDRAETLNGLLYPYRVMEEAAYSVPSPMILANAIDSGELTLDEIREILRFELVHPRFINIIANALMWRAYRDERSLLRRTAIDLFFDGVLRPPELTNYLTTLGIDADYASKITDMLDVSRRKSIRRKLLSYLEKQFLEGYIDRATFTSKLVEYGFDRDIVEEYAALLEYVRDNYFVIKETKDERSSVRTTLVSLFKRGLISEEELERRLRELGFSEIEIMLTITRARLEYDAEQKELLFNDLIEKLKTGLLSKTEFRDNCTRLGISYERCSAYADYYWSKYIGDEFYVITKDERNALASALIKKYLLGFMTEEELRRELERLRFTAEEITLRVERARVEDEVKYLTDLLSEADTLLKKGTISEEEYVSYLVSLGMREDRAMARARRILAARRVAT